MYRMALIVTGFIMAWATPAFAQTIVNTSIFGQVYSAEFPVQAKSDILPKRLGSMDSLAKVMGCLNRGGGSKEFGRVGDATVFAPYYNNNGKEYGIVMLTYLNALAEMRFTYQSMNGDCFFHDLYKFIPSDNNSVKVSFVRRFMAPGVSSSEQIAVQVKLIEEGLVRLKTMAESH
jgi:hypothetical protein